MMRDTDILAALLELPSRLLQTSDDITIKYSLTYKIQGKNLTAPLPALMSTMVTCI